MYIITFILVNGFVAVVDEYGIKESVIGQFRELHFLSTRFALPMRLQ
jgi:hypothetical protein